MADAAKISGKQMKRLQTLWGIFVKSGFASTNPEPRAARLLWVGETIGRQIGSFKDLSAAEAKTAIDAIQKHLPAELLTRSSSRRECGRRGAHGGCGDAATAGEPLHRAWMDARTAGCVSAVEQISGAQRKSADAGGGEPCDLDFERDAETGGKSERNSGN